MKLQEQKLQYWKQMAGKTAADKLLIKKVFRISIIVDIKMLSLQGKISGDIHFDDDEYWTLGSYSGVNLTQVDWWILDTGLLLRGKPHTGRLMNTGHWAPTLG